LSGTDAWLPHVAKFVNRYRVNGPLMRRQVAVDHRAGQGMLPKILGLLRFWEKHTVAPHFVRIVGGPVSTNKQCVV
jgi:hypothetical protein